MPDHLFILPLVAAIAIGWLLGRWDRHARRRMPSDGAIKREAYDREHYREYFVGLNYLLDDKTDEAIESFTRALQVNSDTVPIHLALGTLFRRRGEVQRAIELHQNLLARPQLSSGESLQVQLALARDYLAAGLFDRAEKLLLDLVSQGAKSERSKALALLTDLYQQERDWESALQTSSRLADGDGTPLGLQMAHFCCELADSALKKDAYREAGRLAKAALGHDHNCVRASILLGKIELAQQNYKAAIKHLRQVRDQDPEFVPTVIPLMVKCFSALNDEAELIAYLEEVMQHAPNTTSMLHLADAIAAEKGDYVAGSYITEQLKLRPSVKGFNRLIDMHIKHASSSARESLEVLRGLTGQLEQTKPIYRCSCCGFSGRTLHWQCPTCKRWGSVKPIHGLEGE